MVHSTSRFEMRAGLAYLNPNAIGINGWIKSDRLCHEEWTRLKFQLADHVLNDILRECLYRRLRLESDD